MMYYKIVGDREVFSDCKTIQTNEGIWISNPTAEQIAEAGWTEYVPPVIPPEPITEPDEYSIIQAVKKMLSQSTESLSDEDALAVAALYPTWSSKIGEQVSVGLIFVDGDKVEMRYSNEKLKALQGLFPEKSYNFISRVVRSMGKNHSEYTVDTIDYLTRYSNNMISLSPLQSIDVLPTEQNKAKLYRNYVYTGG